MNDLLPTHHRQENNHYPVNICLQAEVYIFLPNAHNQNRPYYWMIWVVSFDVMWYPWQHLFPFQFYHEIKKQKNKMLPGNYDYAQWFLISFVLMRMVLFRRPESSAHVPVQIIIMFKTGGAPANRVLYILPRNCLIRRAGAGIWLRRREYCLYFIHIWLWPMAEWMSELIRFN